MTTRSPAWYDKTTKRPAQAKRLCRPLSIIGDLKHRRCDAAACGYWNLFRYNFANKAQGQGPFTLESKAPAGGYQEFLMNEGRYSSLTRPFPERGEKLFKKNEQAAMERGENLQKLLEPYA